MKAQEAKQTTIYVVNGRDIEETNLYDHVMESNELCTSPRGVTARYFVETIVHEITFEEINDYFEHEEDHEDYPEFTNFYISGGGYSRYSDWHKDDNSEVYMLKLSTVSHWSKGANNHVIGNEWFLTEQEAEDQLYNSIDSFDFHNDDTRTTHYHLHEDDAITEVLEFLSYDWGVDVDVAKSILQKENKVKEGRINQIIERERKESERINKLVMSYSGLINKIDGESYKDTCNRLSVALNKKIEGKVFHLTVKSIRANI